LKFQNRRFNVFRLQIHEDSEKTVLIFTSGIHEQVVTFEDVHSKALLLFILHINQSQLFLKPDLVEITNISFVYSGYLL
jgi:hypothetical protein